MGKCSKCNQTKLALIPLCQRCLIKDREQARDEAAVKARADEREKIARTSLKYPIPTIKEIDKLVRETASNNALSTLITNEVVILCRTFWGMGALRQIQGISSDREIAVKEAREDERRKAMSQFSNLEGQLKEAYAKGKMDGEAEANDGWINDGKLKAQIAEARADEREKMSEMMGEGMRLIEELEKKVATLEQLNKEHNDTVAYFENQKAFGATTKPFIDYVEGKIATSIQKRDAVVLPKFLPGTDIRSCVKNQDYYEQLRTWWCYEAHRQAYEDSLIQYKLCMISESAIPKNDTAVETEGDAPEKPPCKCGHMMDAHVGENEGVMTACEKCYCGEYKPREPKCPQCKMGALGQETLHPHEIFCKGVEPCGFGCEPHEYDEKVLDKVKAVPDSEQKVIDKDVCDCREYCGTFKSEDNEQDSASKTRSTFQKKVNQYKQKIGDLMKKLRKVNQQERINHAIQEAVKHEIGKSKYLQIVRTSVKASESAEAAISPHNLISTNDAPEKLRRCCACFKTECEHQPTYQRKLKYTCGCGDADHVTHKLQRR